ncbi:MAG: DUF190 domain-containing protein [Deltaproteobacteria bacterium]|nr:MAG: DUF190 domain-containing protein [Deltaproteobacteria bacterium]
MRRLEGEQYLVRIFIGEADRVQGKPLYEVIVKTLKEEGCAGATVLRGIAGFGPHSLYHTEKVLRLSRDLPIVIEFVDTLEKVEAILPKLDRLIESGLITIEKARVIRYIHKHQEEAGKQR